MWRRTMGRKMIRTERGKDEQGTIGDGGGGSDGVAGGYTRTLSVSLFQRRRQ